MIVQPIAKDATEDAPFVLQLFHISDQEAVTGSVQIAPQASAVLNALSAQDIDGDGVAGYPETLVLSTGDIWLPGLFYEASAEIWGLPGAADVLIANEMGIAASTFGNHEFDKGNGPIAELLWPIGETDSDFVPYGGATFPYLTGNVDFSQNAELAPLVTDDAQNVADIPGQIAQTGVVFTEGGTKVGLVGATTPYIDKGLSSPSVGTVASPADPDDIAALAAIIQADVDALLAAHPDLDKVILLAHMQQIAIEEQLAGLLSNVDIIIAGGSNTRLFDENDIAFGGDTAQGVYPIFTTDADGKNVALVNTDKEYKYFGRLVIAFDENGEIIPASYDPEVSGAYATDVAGVARVGGAGMEDPEIVEIANLVFDVIKEGEKEYYAITEEFLNGERFGGGGGRDGVRSQETNLANLTGDANLAYARGYDDSVVVSVKNGGGIRASIGVQNISGLGDVERLPPAEIRDADGSIVKPEGGISSNDVGNVLAFNNGLILLSVTTEELAEVIEEGIAGFTDVDSEASGYLHFAGVRFSFDPDLPAGDRVINAAIVDEETGEVLHRIVENGEVVDNADQTFRIVTLNFLANEGNPFFGVGADRVDLGDLEPNPRYDTVDTFADGSEQDALAEYLNVAFGPEGERTITAEDTTQDFDERIQNVDARADTVFGDAPESGLRVATYNASLNRSEGGDLIIDLSDGDDAQAQKVAAILQDIDADILLLNEFDYDPWGRAVDLFQENYLSVGQDGRDPVAYPYVYAVPSNTGVPSGEDLNGDGQTDTPNDAYGFGEFEGQYAFVILSKHEIDTDNIRSFQNFLWKDMPGNYLTDATTAETAPLTELLDQEAIDAFRLSSKNHVDVPVIVDGQTVHVLASHPTPPVFDDPAYDLNGKRNHDEIRLWADYIDGADYIVDDNGRAGGLDAGARFVIMGDQNADPFDGDSVEGAANQIVDHDLVDGSATDPAITPDSEGGVEYAARDGAPTDHEGNPAFDTSAFDLRVDYVLPSESGFDIEEATVYWPTTDMPGAELIDASDHRAAYIDLEITETDPTTTTIAGIEFIGSVNFAPGTIVFDHVMGGLSSLQLAPETGLYYAISDDQQNYRYFTAEIDLSDGSLDDGDVAIVGEHLLLDANGDPLEAFSIDPEEMTFLPDGQSFIVNTEGFAPRSGDGAFVDPSLPIFDLATNRQIGEWRYDDKFAADPAQESGVRRNAAGEGGTVTPDGATYLAALENALIQDGPAASQETGSPARLVAYDTASGEAVAEYVYQVYPNQAGAPAEDGFQVTGTTAILALDDAGSYLVLERDFSTGDPQTGTGHGGYLYLISTADATDVKDIDALDGVGYKAVSKDFLLDLSTLSDADGNPVVIDNVEGLALGPVLPDGRQSLVIVSDDNFSDSQSTQFMAFALDLETALVRPSADLTFAAYNTMLSSPADVDEGGAGRLRPQGDTGDTLIARLAETEDGDGVTGAYAVARNLAEVVQRERPDLMLVNEIDYDDLPADEADAARLLNDLYFGVGQSGGSPITHVDDAGDVQPGFRYVYILPANTGVPSGFDINNDGIVGEIQQGGDTAGLIGGFDEAGAFVEQPNDAFGFGRYEGQYSMALFSQHEILEDQIRTFQNFLWKDMPDSKLTEVTQGERPLYDPARPFDPENPQDETTSFFTDAEYNALRLSSKTHADIPVLVDGQVVHVLASHPTPATYSLSFGQNEGRNFDELRFWKDYLDGADYIYDDAGSYGGLEQGARFIIAGDLNADPYDGKALPGAADQVVNHPAVIGSADDAAITPFSLGGIEDNDDPSQTGNPAFDTVDYSISEPGRGNVRVDYALPSVAGFDYVDGGVIWPLDADPLSNAVDYPTSDHKMVRVDLNFTSAGGAIANSDDGADSLEALDDPEALTLGGKADEILFAELAGHRDATLLEDWSDGTSVPVPGEARQAAALGGNGSASLLIDDPDLDLMLPAAPDLFLL